MPLCHNSGKLQLISCIGFGANSVKTMQYANSSGKIHPFIYAHIIQEIFILPRFRIQGRAQEGKIPRKK